MDTTLPSTARVLTYAGLTAVVSATAMIFAYLWLVP